MCGRELARNVTFACGLGHGEEFDVRVNVGAQPGGIAASDETGGASLMKMLSMEDVAEGYGAVGTRTAFDVILDVRHE